MTPYYAGIGSRKTPPDILYLMEKIAKFLADDGWVLRSGHASGADQAFERGAGSQAEVFLPWPSFENNVPIEAAVIFDSPTIEAAEFSSYHHPAWEKLGSGARRLHARNAHQIYGPEIGHSAKSSIVICWTPDGSLDGRGNKCGGTGQALRIAASLGIEVINLAREDAMDSLVKVLNGTPACT